MSAGRAVFTPKEDDLQVKVVPAIGRKEGLEIGLGALHRAALGEAPAGGEAEDVGVDREGRHAEGLAHHHAGGLVAHAGQGFERREVGGDDAAMPLDEEARQGDETLAVAPVGATLGAAEAPPPACHGGAAGLLPLLALWPRRRRAPRTP